MPALVTFSVGIPFPSSCTHSISLLLLQHVQQSRELHLLESNYHTGTQTLIFIFFPDAFFFFFQVIGLTGFESLSHIMTSRLIRGREYFNIAKWKTIPSGA